jgi:hypothetical protein
LSSGSRRRRRKLRDSGWGTGRGRGRGKSPEQKVMHVQVDLVTDYNVRVLVGAVGQAVEGKGDGAVG